MATRKHKRKKNFYTQEDRLKALSGYVNLGSDIEKASLELKIPKVTLYDWVKANPEYIAKEVEAKRVNSLSIQQTQQELSIPSLTEDAKKAKKVLLDHLQKIVPTEKSVGAIANALMIVHNIIKDESNPNPGAIKGNTFLNYIEARTYNFPNAEVFLSEEDLKEE